MLVRSNNVNVIHLLGPPTLSPPPHPPPTPHPPTSPPPQLSIPTGQLVDRVQESMNSTHSLYEQQATWNGGYTIILSAGLIARRTN